MTLRRYETARGHWYQLDGVKIDGVTTLISQGLPKPALPYWAARCVAEYVADNLGAVNAMAEAGRDALVAALKEVPWAQRDAAAVRGTEVHTLAERLIRGEEVEVPEHLAGHVEAYVKFLDQWKPEPIIVEAPVGSRRWRYAGTVDMVVRLPDGRRVIADIKTTSSGIWPETAYQLAAYRFAEFYVDAAGQEQPMPQVDAGYAIWVRADGYDVIPVECGEHVFKTFLHIAWVARAARDAKNLIGEAIYPNDNQL